MRIKHENIFKELINGMYDAASKNPQSPIIWCGENVWLFRILEILSMSDISVEAVVDNSPNKIGIKTDYYEIFGFDYISNVDDKAIFFICNLRGQEILSQLISLGIERERIFIFRPIEYITQKFEQEFLYEMYDKEMMTHAMLQAALFNILVYFRDFCERYGLRYYLYDGTLLGAVRHKGFIPWDDDIDVAMPYEDYLVLKEKFNESERYSLVTWDMDESYEFSLPRVVDTSTVMTIPGNTIIGCYLDIFLLGGYPDDKDGIVDKWKSYKKAEKDWHAYYVLNDTKIEINDTRQNIIDKIHDISFDESHYVGVMRTERQKPWAAPKEWFDEITKVEFRGEIFDAPIGYDAYLRMKYGDYMTVPEVNKRDIHGFRVYKIEEKHCTQK